MNAQTLRAHWKHHRSGCRAVAHGSGIIITLFLAFVPLFNLLGYEFSLAIAIWMSLLIGPLTFSHLSLGTRDEAPRGPLSTLIALWLHHLVFLVPPLLIISLNALRVPVCDYFRGLAFYVLIPGVSLLWATLVAWIAFALGHKRRWQRLSFYYGIFLASLVGGALFLALEPPIVAVNPFLGYFAGSIYDEALAVPLPLLAYRLTQLALIAALAFALELAWRRREALPRPAGLLPAFVFAASLTILGFSFHTELGYSIDREDIEEELGGRTESEHFVFIHPTSADWRNRMEWIVEDHEFRYDQLHQNFYKEVPDGKVKVFLYPNREVKGRLMGAKRTQIAKLWLNEVHLLYKGYGDSVMAHELSHVFSAPYGSGPLKLSARGGVIPNMGVIEGLATATQWDGRELTPHAWSAALIELELAPPIESILDPAGFWSRHSKTVYTLMGSFARYQMDTHGPERYLEAYADGDFEAAYGVPVSTLADDWRAFLETIELSEHEIELARFYYDRPSIFGKTCARTLAERRQEASSLLARGKHDHAITILEASLEEDPQNLQLHGDLIKTLVKAKRYDEARALTEKLLEAKLSMGQRATYRALLGDILWQSGDATAAIEVYQETLEVPGLPPASRRALDAKMTALQSDDETQQVLFDYFFEEASAAKKISALVAAQNEQSPALISYLIGLRAHHERAWSLTIQGLEEALESGQLSSAQQDLALQLAGEARYFVGDLEQAEAHFNKRASSTRYSGHRAKANDWLDRCTWKRKQ